jgi:hypothetical protein
MLAEPALVAVRRGEGREQWEGALGGFSTGNHVTGGGGVGSLVSHQIRVDIDRMHRALNRDDRGAGRFAARLDDSGSWRRRSWLVEAAPETFPPPGSVSDSK